MACCVARIRDPTAFGGPGSKPELASQQEFHAHGRRYVRNLPCRSKPSGSGIHAKRHNGIGILIGNEQELAGRIDAEVARGPALG